MLLTTDASLRDDGAWRHGSMVVMRSGSAQGYDSRNQNFRADSAVEMTLALPAERSLVSSISHENLPNQVMHHAMMRSSERARRRCSRIWRTCRGGTLFGRPSSRRQADPLDLHWGRLLALEPTSTLVPDWATFERYVERPWIDHPSGSWLGQLLLPTENMPAYGRENARIVGAASLMLHLDVRQTQKHDLLVGLVEVGIDLRGIAMAVVRWSEGGGHASGRKRPIVAAGIMLGDRGFAELSASAVFQEDTQTYAGAGWADQQALWRMVNHQGCRQPCMQRRPTHDPIMTPRRRSAADRAWWSPRAVGSARSGPVSWPGLALAALLMGARADWGHEPFFETVDD